MATYTNKFNLPDPLVRALTNDSERVFGNKEIGVSELIQPARKTILTQRHNKEIVVDVSSRLWALLGSSVHYVIQKADTVGVSSDLLEERLECAVEGHKVIGHSDLLTGEKIVDWKVTSVYALLMGLKPEWEAQVNIYAYMYRKMGFPVGEAYIYAILRDWKVSEYRTDRDGNYPPCPFMEMKVPLWSDGVVESYMSKRIHMLNAEHLNDDDELAICTEEERWHKEDKWAVVKASSTPSKATGYRRAVNGGLKTTKEAAEAMAAGKSDLLVEHRLGEDPRCRDYCDVAPFCFHYKERYGNESK